MRLLHAAALSLGALAAPSLARAQEANVEALQRRGLALREQGRPADALELFRQAQARQPEPRTLARIGLAEAELGRWVDAEQHLSEALAANRDRWIRHNHDDLEAELDAVRGHLGLLEVVVRTPAARLSLNGGEGRPLPLPGPLRVTEGTTNLDISADGCEGAHRTITVAPRGTARVELDLVCRPPAPPAVVSVTATPVVALPAPAPATPVVARAARSITRPPTAGPNASLRVAAWASWGGAVLFAGAGIAGLVAGGAAADRWNDDARCLAPGRSRESLCADDRSLAETMGPVATAGFVGAGVLAAAGAVLWTLSGRSGERPAARALLCAPSIAAPSVRCTFTF